MANAINIQSTCVYWKQFDLPSLQKDLDEKATELANHQDDSENSRKKLVDLCRDFKKNTDEEVKKAVTPVLKCFQGEVDNLSKRSKVAEAAFLSLYKKIIESPDPAPALELTTQLQRKLQKLQDVEIENSNLKETLHQYNEEFAEVKNQEVVIRQLKEKIRTFEEQLESIVKTKLAEKEHMLTKLAEEKEKRFQSDERLLQSKLNEAESRADALESALKSAQHELYTLKTHSDEMGSARNSEMDLLMSDLEKANLRAATAERELEMVKEQQYLAKVKIECPDESSALENLQNNEIQLAVKDRQVSQLLDEITQLKNHYENDIAQKDEQIKESAKLFQEKMQTVQKLETTLNNHRDYDEIKRELNILKSIYLGEEPPVEKEQKPLATPVDSKSLELLLLDKNKTLQLDKTALLARKRELESNLSKKEAECIESAKICEEQKLLILKLEEDLMSVQNLQRSENVMFESSDTSTLDLISDAVGYNRSVVRSVSPTNAESLLPVITNQRERLRVRVQELEEINMQHQQNNALLNSEVERLRSDNVKLYEKIKFLQSYQGSKSTSMSSGTKHGDDVLNKYSSDYEASLDPFRRFGVQERQRRYQSLSAQDKVTLSMSRVIMSSGTARAIFLLYLIVLHCLVFTVLYKLAYTESCRRDAETDCIEKYHEHMQMVHGDGSF